MRKKTVSKRKAKIILHEGKVRGRKLTEKQRRFFGARASGSPQRNPKGLVKIYDKVTRIEAEKGSHSLYPGERFFHNFRRPYPSMWGTRDRKVIILK